MECRGAWIFDPTYKGKTVQTGPAMEHTNRETYSRDVHMFIQRAKDFMPAKGEVVIRENLFTCLRGMHRIAVVHF